MTLTLINIGEKESENRTWNYSREENQIYKLGLNSIFRNIV